MVHGRLRGRSRAGMVAARGANGKRDTGDVGGSAGRECTRRTVDRGHGFCFDVAALARRGRERSLVEPGAAIEAVAGAVVGGTVGTRCMRRLPRWGW